MLTFYYIICDVPKKEKYEIKKLIFIDNKLDSIDNFNLNLGQVSKLKNSLSESQYKIINDCYVNLDSFLKNINLFIA
tara:strand:- start:2982 stop:3212 length:231 start_codon:yes stop_codon:yes gene_type:complete